MKSSLEFDEAYRRLNPEQKKAVDTIDGPVMVIAGPGTGKTQILTLRIANILLQTDTPPEAILALTFTESGVRSMRERLSKMIGPSGHRVNIYTFHGLANHVIGQYPERFPEIAGAAPISDPQKHKIIEEILDNGTFPKLKPFGNPYFNVRSMLSEISNLKRETITPEKFSIAIASQTEAIMHAEDLNHEKGAHKGKMKKQYKDELIKLEKNVELAEVYDLYEKKIREENLIDYEDMIVKFVEALETDEEFRLILQEEYQYILADEHQDTNQGQNRILELLSAFHENPNLFVVGDEKQAIFRFQGASLANFLYFKDLYPQAMLISLEQNYRSTQHILDASHSVIVNNKVADEKLRVKLQANTESESKAISFMDFEEEENELRYIADEIKRLIEGGVDQNEIAVLVKENKDTFKVARTLGYFDLVTQNLSEENILDDMMIKSLIAVLRAVHEPLEDAYMAKALHAGIVALDPLLAHLIIGESKKQRKTVFEILKTKGDQMSISDEQKGEVSSTLDKIERWIKMAKNESGTFLLSQIVEESGLVNQVLSDTNSLADLERIKKFFVYAENLLRGKQDPSLETLLSEIDTMTLYDIKMPFSGSESKTGVRIMTAHRSKGREYEYVFVPFCRDKYWGGKSKRSLFTVTVGNYANRELSGSIDDERRLFYVALTRAKAHVYLSTSRRDIDGREYIHSIFVDEIDDELIQVTTTADIEKEYIAKPVLITESRPNPIALYEEEFLRNMFLERGLSVTALNNYLRCSWNFFYKNLLRIPSVYSKQQSFGNAVHYAFDRLYRHVHDGGDFEKGVLLGAYDYALSREILTDSVRDELTKKGHEILEVYYKEFASTLDKNDRSELSVKGVSVPFVWNNKQFEVLLNGKLDKVGQRGDGYLVTDYKTGKRKTRNDVMGKTASSDGGYYRQLVFYKLLLSLFNEGEYNMKQGEIIFVVPDTKGKIHSEVFDIESSEVEELKDEIARVSSEIMDLDFTKNACGEKECEYCELAYIQK